MHHLIPAKSVGLPAWKNNIRTYARLQGHPLLRLENAVCTPHIGYVTQESYALYFGAAFDHVVNFARGCPIGLVNPEVLGVHP